MRDGIKGSGFGAQLRLNRGLPDRSGESTLQVLVSVIPNGVYLKKHGLRLYGTDAPSLEVSAVTSTGTIPFGGTMSHIGGTTKSSIYSLGMFGGAFFGLPASATAVRATLHLGVSSQAAQEGTSVIIPVSAIPVVDPLESLSGRHGGPGLP